MRIKTIVWRQNKCCQIYETVLIKVSVLISQLKENIQVVPSDCKTKEIIHVGSLDDAIYFESQIRTQYMERKNF